MVGIVESCWAREERKLHTLREIKERERRATFLFLVFTWVERRPNFISLINYTTFFTSEGDQIKANHKSHTHSYSHHKVNASGIECVEKQLLATTHPTPHLSSTPETVILPSNIPFLSSSSTRNKVFSNLEGKGKGN